MNKPKIIQGGMGIGTSSWRLARAVAKEGQLGVVSGTALPHVLARRLQAGDPEGHLRRALEVFPVRAIAERILERFFVAGGIPSGTSYKGVPMFSLTPTRESEELAVAANFVEVFLAKEAHTGPVGINYLEKIKLPLLASLYGALLAGVDYVFVGAGIPRQIPAAISALIAHEEAALKVQVERAEKNKVYEIRFSPKKLVGEHPPPLRRPFFGAIVSSATLARSLSKSTNPPDGFVVESSCAGGHNAPPRGPLQLDARGEPIYGPRDEADYTAIRELGLPFWIAGAQATPEHLREALLKGAAGIQVGTAFAFCRESGFIKSIQEQAIAQLGAETADVRTDTKASPTGFPFKLLNLQGTLGREEMYRNRARSVCDVGLLRTPYKKEDGALGYRCPAEPITDYLRKGGALEDCEGRLCLCNGLLSSIGLGQTREGGVQEPPLVTSGTDLSCVRRLAGEEGKSYSAADVITYLLAG